MRPITLSHTIPLPREVVFAFVADSTNDPLWCPLVPTTEQIDGSGPGFGAKYRYTQKVGKGRVVQGIITVTDFEPHYRLEWAVEDSARRYRIEMTFEDDGAGTRVTQVSHPSFKGRYKLLGPLARGRMEKVLASQMRRLERHLVGAEPTLKT